MSIGLSEILEDPARVRELPSEMIPAALTQIASRHVNARISPSNTGGADV